jgi:acetolactate synthase regulatory subunit
MTFDSPRAASPHRHSTQCFSVQALAEPSVMPRVLEQFAKRGLVPSAWHSTCQSLGSGSRELTIDIQVEALDPADAALIAAGLHQIVSVQSVLTAEKRYALSA